MKRLTLILALALAVCGQAQYSNQATQRWTEMRLAALEAKLRSEINAVVVSTNYATAQEFTNAVQSVALTATAQTAAALAEVYNANFAASLSGGSVTQYVVYAASEAAKLVTGLTNSLPVGARFTIRENDQVMQAVHYFTADRKAELSFNVGDGKETMGILMVNSGTPNERDFTQETDDYALFTQYYPTLNRNISYVIMKTVMAR